jgi:Holliday junction resolvase RusA-like endonuclease
MRGRPDAISTVGGTEAVFDDDYVERSVERNSRRYEFVVLDPPTPMGRKRTAFKGKDGVAHYPETKDVRSVYHIRQAWAEAYPEAPLIDGAVRLTVRLWHKCPAVASLKKRKAAWMNLAAMQTKPDANNVLNQVCDALTGYAYVDDKQITVATVMKYYAVDRDGNHTSPRMTVVVEAL